MTLRKRLRIALAAFTQDWYTRRCVQCRQEFVAMAGWRGWEIQDTCLACEERAMTRWIEDFQARYPAKGHMR